MKFDQVMLFWIAAAVSASLAAVAAPIAAMEKQITTAPYGHILTNIGVWSPDSKWLVYDVRSDAAGDTFDGNRIERVHVETGEVQVLFESKRGANCGVATYGGSGSGTSDRVVFIHGPEHPDSDWKYAAYHRRGVIVNTARPGVAVNLDARDLTPPFTSGALRGGTHVHTFSETDRWVSFTYEDHVLATQSASIADADHNQRGVGVSVPVRAVEVPASHPRNHGGSHFSVLATRTWNSPRPGSDEISRAFSDAWVGHHGYLRDDGTRQRKAIAFQGQVLTKRGKTMSEVYIVDLPDDVTQPGPTGPLPGTRMQRPQPPRGATQRRLTFTADRKYPGIQGVRHWLRSSPDGSRIAFLMKSDSGVSQLWIVSPKGGSPRQVTQNEFPVGSAFSWSPEGTLIAHTMSGCICVTVMATGETMALTAKNPDRPLRPEACVFSPDGRKIAYVRRVTSHGETWNQIFVLALPRIGGTHLD